MLKNKTVVIAGGLGKIGVELSKLTLEQSAELIVLDTDLTLSHTLPKAHFISANITDEASMKAAVIKLKAFGKPLDVFVNCSYPRAKNYGADALDIGYQDFCETIQLHLGGFHLATQLMVKLFIEQGHGNIIHFSSVYGTVAPKFDIYESTTMTTPLEYAVVKAGINQMTRFWAKRLKGKNIRVNAISPGGLFNHQPESFLKKYREHCLNKGMLDFKDLFGTFLFLASDQSQFVNGQNLIIDDGFSL